MPCCGVSAGRGSGARAAVRIILGGNNLLGGKCYGWIPANHLKPGTHLKTPDGQSAVVVGASVPAVHDGWMWDLTVPGNNDHDFYVLPAPNGDRRPYDVIPGDTSILVHNTGGEGWCGGPIPNTNKPIVGDWPDRGQTSFYVINDPATGRILKRGITDTPHTRYDMSDFEYWNNRYGGNFQMTIIKNFDSEPDAWAAEYYMTTRYPGPENLEKYRGTIPARPEGIGDALRRALNLPSG